MSRSKEEHFKARGAAWVASAYGNIGSVAFDRLGCAQTIAAKIKPRSLLDIGCGDARYLASMSTVEHRVGVDHSPSMLEMARATCDKTPIHLAHFDFNDDHASLRDFGLFDLVSMLGVIHYLHDPLKALRTVREICADSLLITFRNRLYNINPASAYRDTALTRRDAAILLEESAYWNHADHLVFSKEQRAKWFPTIHDSRSYEGITDIEWNPEGLKSWRQFTPMDAIVLLDQAGFEISDILPLNVTRDSDSNPLRQLAKATSFMILARSVPNSTRKF